MRGSSTRVDASCAASAISVGTCVGDDGEDGGGCDAAAVRLAAVEGLYAAVAGCAGHLPHADVALLEDLRDAARAAAAV